MKETSTVENPLRPIVSEHVHTLILGTMASPASRKAGFQYGHPQNRFWKVLAAVFHESIPSTRQEREALLSSHGIALWDVLQSCEIQGASDASIKNPVPNDIAAFVKEHDIERIFTTGATAKKLYDRFFLSTIPIPCVMLPSPSPANCRISFDEMVLSYRILCYNGSV